MKVPSRNLAEIRVRAERELDETVGAIRSRYITISPGMELVYATKEREARAYLADPYIDPQEVAHVIEEAEGLGIHPQAMASLIVHMAEEWRVVSARLEKARAQIKLRIGSATTPVEIRNAITVNWDAVLAGASV